MYFFLQKSFLRQKGERKDNRKRAEREKREKEQMHLIQMTFPQTILDLCEEEECRICGVRLLRLDHKK